MREGAKSSVVRNCNASALFRMQAIDVSHGRELSARRFLHGGDTEKVKGLETKYGRSCEASSTDADRTLESAPGQWDVGRRLVNRGQHGHGLRTEKKVLPSDGRRNSCTIAIWLILPVVICLSQRLSHACLSTYFYTVKPRMAH